MQNWDRNRQDVKFKQKLNNVKSTLPKISYANNSGPSIIAKKSSNPQNNQNLNNLENLYINVTYKMKQGPNSSGGQSSSSSTATPQSQGGSIPSITKGKSKDMKRQNYLKHLLNEFGLSQYLRKLYELGYDDNNVYKIGLMNRKAFQELEKNMKMFPGQSIKMEKLYNYLKQLNLANTMYNTRLMGGRAVQMRNTQKKPATCDSNKRRVNTASGHNNIINNNNNNNNNINYGYNNMNYGNNYLNNNYNINNKIERPKTSTNFKMKPIQKMPNNYPTNMKPKSKTIDNNMNINGLLSPNMNNRNPNEYNNKNNILLNSFKKGDLGYGFYMNNNNYFEEEKNKKSGNIDNYNYNFGNDILQKDLLDNNFSSQNSKEFNKFENINSFPNDLNNNYNNNDGEIIEEKMNEDIDNMLKFYMNQLNEKLDDSYGTIEDSSLSHNISIPFPEPISNNNKININNNQILKNNNKNIKSDKNDKIQQNTGKVKLPSIKEKQNLSKELKNEKNEEKRNENKSLKSQKKIEQKNDINKNENKENNKIPQIKKEIEKEKVVDKEKEKEKEKINEKEKVNEKNENINDNSLHKINESNISKIREGVNKKGEFKNDSLIEDIILEDGIDDIIKEENKNKEKEINKEIKKEDNKPENIKENIKDNNIEIKKEENIPNKNNNINNINNQKEIKKQEEKEKDLDIDENIEIIEEKKEEKEPEIKYGFHGEKTDYENQNTQQAQNDRYSLEENIYDNLRLTKSSGGDYLHQNMEKFDIEYMCRCLSLAIMKLLESSKGKQHITDIMEKENEKFEFFNNLFNSNMDIISDFFGKNKDKANNNNESPQIISNLEKLELKENKAVDDNDDITFLKHIKKDIDEKLLKEQEIKNKQFKLKNNLADIEKDIKFIDEFFSMGRKRVKNYQNISEKSKNIMMKELSYINEVDSEINNTNKTNSIISNDKDKNNSSKHSLNENSNMKEILNENEIIKEEDNDNKKEDEDNYENEFEDDNNDDKNENKNDISTNNENKDKKDEEKNNNDLNNKFSSLSNINSNKDILDTNEKKEDDINQNLKIDEIIKNNNDNIKEDLPPINQPNDILNKNDKEVFESGSMESDYIIDVTTIDKFKAYLLKQAEVFDDDFIYSAMHIPTRKYVPPPDPQVVFEFCANIMILTKMEKEVIIITLLYLERFIFNTGLLLTSRNWRRIIFITMAIASKIWDDDSFENNHFAQVFKHLSIGEINLLERTFLELINYKVYVKCSEYFKYFFIIKSIALKYNYNGVEMIPISVERMMKIQEYAYQMQKRVRKKVNLSNSTKF